MHNSSVWGAAEHVDSSSSGGSPSAWMDPSVSSTLVLDASAAAFRPNVGSGSPWSPNPTKYQAPPPSSSQRHHPVPVDDHSVEWGSVGRPSSGSSEYRSSFARSASRLVNCYFVLVNVCCRSFPNDNVPSASGPARAPRVSTAEASEDIATSTSGVWSARGTHPSTSASWPHAVGLPL